MKKILFFAAAALSLAACSNEGVITGGVDIPQPSEGTNLSFNLSLPGGEAITYAESHTDAERQIDRLDIYQFKVASGGETTFETVYEEVTVGKETAGKRKVNINVDGKGDKVFVLVANNISTNPGKVSAIKAPSLGTNLSDFKAKVTDALKNVHMNGKALLMTGESATVDVKEGTATPEVAVQLTRAMARLDIINKDNNLVIKRVKLENTSDKAFLFAHANEGTTNADGVPAGIANANNLPLVELLDHATAEIGYEKTEASTVPPVKDYQIHYKHVFYPYPNTSVAEAAQAPTLIIEGILYPGTENAQKVVYRKPLKKEGAPQHLGFKRNHVYKFVISKATRDQLDATIKVDMWNEDEIPAPIVKVTAPEVIRVNVEGPSGVEYSIEDRTITLPKTGTVVPESTGALAFDVKSTTDWGFTVQYLTEGTGGWITIANPPFSSDDNPSLDQLPNRVRIRVTENNTVPLGVRTAKLIFHSKVDPTKKVEFTLTQQK